jgi:hypothetical protein
LHQLTVGDQLNDNWWRNLYVWPQVLKKCRAQIFGKSLIDYFERRHPRA